MYKKILMAAALAVTSFSAYAQQSEKGLKDIYANYFRIGTCYPYQKTNDAALRNVILREFNSLTHENDLKPEATMIQSGSTDENIQVQLNTDAKAVMAVCTTYKIPLRGHTLVWHQQTPNWFFYANMQQSGALATKEVMNKRMESYIKNIFNAIRINFPTLNLYAYDVVNEIFKDNGSQRDGGDPSPNSDQSTWIKIYNNSSFVDSAFTYARKYAPAGCKLFYNDFNEYHPDGKRDSIAALYNRLKAKNVIDGIGMQSHLGTGWPDVGTYKSALTRFVNTGAEIHVTELDITIEDGSNETAQAEKYKALFQALKEAREEGANITSVSVWGVIDEWSWRNSKNPLLFKTTNFTKKAAYNQVAALIPDKDHGDGKNPPFNTPKPGEATTDKNGYFFHHDFEDGTTQGWARRGPETVANSSAQKNSGTKSIYVSGRNDNWNGAQFSLPSEFKAGKEYSFSAMARHEGQGTIKFKLSLQYENAAGEKQYPSIDSVEAVSGTWVQLAKTSYKLPEGGSGFAVYVELDNASANFYVDDAMGGVAGATINPDGTPVELPPTSILNGKNAARGHTPLVTVRGRTLNVNAGTADSKARVRLVNMMGKTVASFNVSGNAKLSLKNIPAGAYIIEARRIKDGYKTTSAVTLK